MGWIPWSTMMALLPYGGSSSSSSDAAEEERRRRREELMQTVQEHSRTALRWSIRLAQFGLILSFLFATATILYSLLYYLVIPARLHEQDVFFDYGNHASLAKSGLSRLTLPVAKLNLLASEQQWEASDLVEKPTPQSQVLVPGVKYDVYLDLVVPESQTNMDIGMFMVSTALHSHKEQFLASSERPVIVRDSNPLVRYARMAFSLLPHIIGLTEPSQTILVQAINGYKESKAHPLTTVTITLNNPEVQIYSARLTIIAQLSGVRYLMYHWSLPTALLVILNIVFAEAVALMILYAFYSLPQPEAETMMMETGTAGVLMAEQEPEPTKTVDQGALFEQHRSGGIPPVHVERAPVHDPCDTSELMRQASAKAMEDDDDENMQLRYRTSASLLSSELARDDN